MAQSTSVDAFRENDAFRQHVLKHLIWSMKGLLADNYGDSAALVPQHVDSRLYFPYRLRDYEPVQWAMFEPKPRVGGRRIRRAIK